MRNGLIVYRDGIRQWYLDDQLHRENDLPAYIWPDGSQLWYHHGQIHRENGPAIIWDNGSQLWFHHGKCHRENGPAIINSDGSRWWYLDDKEINVAKWIRDNNLPSWEESWDDMTWSLFRLEFL